MKKISSILTLIILSIILASCNDYHDMDNPVIDENENMVFHAGTYKGTRTSLGQDGNILWNVDDSIHVFCNDSRGDFAATTNKESEYTDFVGKMNKPVDIDGKNIFWALYPYSKFGNTFFSDNENSYITTSIPSVQYSVEDSFDKKAFLSVAKTTNDMLYFKNVCGGIRFSLSTDKIRQVVFLSKGISVAGRINIFIKNDIPEIEFISSEQSITLVAAEGGIFKSNTWYYIAAAPAILENGFTIKLYSEDNEVYEYNHDDKVEIKRATFGEIPEIDKKASRLDISTAFSGTASGNFNIYYDINGESRSTIIEPDNTGNFFIELPIAERYYFTKENNDVNKTLLTVNKFPNCANSYSMTFDRCSALTAVSNIDGSRAFNFSGMFQNCAKLTSISNIDVSSGTDFWAMFYGCSSLEEIPMLDVSNGTNFRGMFSKCVSLNRIPELDLSSGTDFSGMFSYCTNLDGIPDIDVSKGTDFSGIFQGCTSLKTIPAINVSSGRDFSSMFMGCESLTSIPELDLSSGVNFESIFRGCSSLEDIPMLDVSKGTAFSTMFYGCKSLKSIPELDLSSGQSFNALFQYCESLESIPLIDVSNGTDFSYMFFHCSSLKQVPALDFSNGTIFTATFSGCSSLTEIPMLDVSKGTDFSRFFMDCTSLESIPQLNTSSGIKFYKMFTNCSSLTDIPLLDVSNGEKFDEFLSGCTALRSIPEFDFSNAVSLASLFKDCISIETIPELNFSKGVTLYRMFQGCSSIKYLPNLNFSSGEMFRSIFDGCTSLLKIGEISFSKEKSSQNLQDMFKDCTSLTNIDTFNGLSIDGSSTLSTLDFSSTNLDEKSLAQIASGMREAVNNPKIIFGTTLWNKLSTESKTSLENKGYTILEKENVKKHSYYSPDTNEYTEETIPFMEISEVDYSCR